MTAEIIQLDAERERRHYINLANGSWDWQQVKASWALSGLSLDDDDAERAGRMIAGDMTLDEVYQAILQHLDIKEPDPSNLTDCRI
jgi:hypothetical protein